MLVFRRLESLIRLLTKDLHRLGIFPKSKFAKHMISYQLANILHCRDRMRLHHIVNRIEGNLQLKTLHLGLLEFNLCLEWVGKFQNHQIDIQLCMFSSLSHLGRFRNFKSGKS